MKHMLDFSSAFLDEDLAEELAAMSPATLEKGDKKFSTMSKVYSFASENLAGYFPSLPLSESSVLTVGASFDHVINAYLLGAKEATAFDINILAGLYSSLKLAAIENLHFDEFRSFFLRDNGENTRALEFKVYEGLREDLSNPARVFFDRMYFHCSNNGFLLRNSSLFNLAYDDDALKIQSNPYMQSEDEFEKAKSMLAGKKTRWVYSSLYRLPQKINQKYDVILLSNIADYAKAAYGESNHLETFCTWEIEPLKQMLNEKGIIAAAYVYEARKNNSDGEYYRTDVDNPARRKKALSVSGMDYTELYFKSVMDGKEDAVVLLQRRETK